jgi:hypothetical protein
MEGSFVLGKTIRSVVDDVAERLAAAPGRRTS